MDTATKPPPDDTLYEADFHAWCLQQAAYLRARARPGANDGLDYENLAEEIDSLGRSDRRELKSRLRVLLCHLLKWRHQRELRGRSWQVTISKQRDVIASLLEESPSLVALSREAVAEVYLKAARDAGQETLLGAGSFPAACPFTEAQVFDLDFLPTDLDAPGSGSGEKF